MMWVFSLLNSIWRKCVLESRYFNFVVIFIFRWRGAEWFIVSALLAVRHSFVLIDTLRMSVWAGAFMNIHHLLTVTLKCINGFVPVQRPSCLLLCMCSIRLCSFILNSSAGNVPSASFSWIFLMPRLLYDLLTVKNRCWRFFWLLNCMFAYKRARNFSPSLKLRWWCNFFTVLIDILSLL